MLDREFFLGFIKIHILYHASKESIFGAEMTQELTRHGYTVSPGTLYPTLHRLEKEGYLRSSLKVVDGKVRKYYQATAEGKRVLERSRKSIRELVGRSDLLVHLDYLEEEERAKYQPAPEYEMII